MTPAFLATRASTPVGRVRGRDLLLLGVVIALLALSVPAGAQAVIGGKVIRASRYPGVVQVVANDFSGGQGTLCGGALIAPRVVVTCHGDSGTPLLSANGSSVLGTVSTSNSFCGQGASIYTRLTSGPLRRWVERQIKFPSAAVGDAAAPRSTDQEAAR